MKKIKLILLSALMFANMAYCGVIYQDSLDGSNSDNWTTSRGNWKYDSGKIVSATNGENRIFTSIDTTEEYTIEFTGNLVSGSGWGFFFGSDLSASNTVSGMNFQYDNGYAGGAYLLRKWDNNSESVVACVKTTLDLNNTHNFTLQVSSSGFTAYQDGVEVLSYSGQMNLVGSYVGLRTWSTQQAEFSNLTISSGSVPEPATIALATLGMAVIAKRRKIKIN